VLTISIFETVEYFSDGSAAAVHLAQCLICGHTIETDKTDDECHNALPYRHCGKLNRIPIKRNAFFFPATIFGPQ